jgi:hypothetical protein
VATDEWGKSRSLTSFGMTHQVGQRPFTALTKFTGGWSHPPPNKGGCRTLCVFKGCGFCRVHCADEFQCSLNMLENVSFVKEVGVTPVSKKHSPPKERPIDWTL